MGKYITFLAWFLFSVLLINACSQPFSVGEDLLEQDQEDVLFTDTISISTKTVIRDSVVTFNSIGPPGTFPLGFYDDPLFGTNKVEYYMQLTPASLNFPLQEGTTIDSVILSLAVDSANTLGNLQSNLQLEIYEMEDSFETDVVYYSNQEFAVKSNLLGSYDDTPSLSDVSGLVADIGDTISGKMIKIPLDNELGGRLIDSLVLAEFDQSFFGLQIKVTNSVATESLLGLIGEDNQNITGINVYYTTITDNDTTSDVYRFLMSPVDVRIIHVERDITGTVVMNALSGGGPDDRLYVQGLNGPDVQIDLSSITNLGAVLINNATLEFTVANDDGDMKADYPPVSSLLLARLSDDDSFTGIDDLNFGTTFYGGIFEVSDEDPDNVQGTYGLILSDYIQKVVDGDEGSILYLRAFPKINNPRRSVLFGDGSIDYKPKLELTYTRINQ